jgi:hypothetical protein
MKQIIDAIKTVGFPIVMCLLLFYIIFVSLDKMTVSINSNTDAVTKLTMSIEKLICQSSGVK